MNLLSRQHIHHSRSRNCRLQTITRYFFSQFYVGVILDESLQWIRSARPGILLKSKQMREWIFFYLKLLIYFDIFSVFILESFSFLEAYLNVFFIQNFLQLIFLFFSLSGQCKTDQLFKVLLSFNRDTSSKISMFQRKIYFS